MGWWFGRILTFEVIADETPPTLRTILADASRDEIAADDVRTIGGYAAYGSSTRAAVQPLVDTFGVELFDDGSLVRTAMPAAPILVCDEELGSSADQQNAARFRREQLPVRAVSGVMRLSYYDAQRDYQTGEVRAVAGEQHADEVQRELPGVLGADDAKSLINAMLARSWNHRERLTVRLPQAYASLKPGELVEVGLTPPVWTVEKCTVDSFVVVAELRPAQAATASLAGDGGRVLADADVAAGPLTLALFDVPDPLDSIDVQPSLLLAAASSTPGWKRAAINIDVAGRAVTVATARRKSVLGHCLTVLGSGSAELLDLDNSVDVELIDPDQWLTSCDDQALAAGANLAVVGCELLQFGSAVPIGARRFRLSRLLRGRRGTEWALPTHAANESFCLLERETLQRVTVSDWTVGSAVTATGPMGASAAKLVMGESRRPPSPTKLAYEVQANGELRLNWVRRSRRGWAWADEIDAPLGEGREEYRVTVVGAGASVDFTSAAPALTLSPDQLPSSGPEGIRILVRQIGDVAVSHPAELTLAL